MKKILVLIMCMLLLTACNNKEKEETQTSDTTRETTTEKSTRTPNSIVGTWYELITYDYLNRWTFNEDGTYEFLDENETDDNFKYRGNYTVADNVVTMINYDGRVDGKYRIKYTDYGVKFMYADRAGKPRELYESRQQVLESSEDYYNTPTYYRTIADEAGYVIEEDGRIIYVGYDDEITIPSNIEILNSFNAFEKELKKVTIPGTVKIIDEYAFQGDFMDCVYIEEGVEEIGDGAFDLTGVSEIHFPKSVKKMGEDLMTNIEDEPIIDEVKKYVKKDSYAHKYFVKHGATDNLIIED
ncbi:MAG: leucine-rich repeat domain-containing protein [Lachnospiraceae bacterium]|nr:leucine-rich repeat domain-containing protein [Lachnospiraceae bacterium]